MRNRVLPWSNHRQILWAIGVFGLLLLAFGLFIAWLFQGGFGPGSQGTPPDLADLFGVMLFSVHYVYYIFVAHRAWTRKLWFIGVVIHSLLFILFLISILQTRGESILVLPIFLIGPVTWIFYAKRNTFSDQSG